MYHELSEHPTDAELRQYYEQMHKDAEAIMQEVWKLRGWTVKWKWHAGHCDDCEFLFDETGKCLGTKHGDIPQESQLAGKIDKLKLCVSHTKKSVKISNRYDEKPVQGKGRNLRFAYMDWLLNVEKQKAEERKCAAN